jgi:hypothetical protein
MAGCEQDFSSSERLGKPSMKEAAPTTGGYGDFGGSAVTKGQRKRAMLMFGPRRG